MPTAAIAEQNTGTTKIRALAKSLDKEYKPLFDDYIQYHTGEYADSYSMICEMGQAIPVKGRYRNSPITYNYIPIVGLRLELIARLADKSVGNKLRSCGFVVVTENQEALLTFNQSGDYSDNERWNWDNFICWYPKKEYIRVQSMRHNQGGYASAYFDLRDGNGFYYKTKDNSKPDYRLYGCRKVLAQKLPVYDSRDEE